uniref:hypothetical protein n=1 Tax=Phocaeicola coprophilus TaxID=387090 RepID=UPI00402A454F
MKNIFLSGFIGLLLFSACQQKKEQGEWKLVWEENFNEQKLDTTIWSMIPRGGGWATYMASYPELYQFTDTTIRLMAVRNTRASGRHCNLSYRRYMEQIQKRI